MSAEFYGYFDSVGDDERVYDASQFAKLLRALCVSGACSGLTVAPDGTGLGMTVAPGSCALNGYLYELRDDGGAQKTLACAVSGAADRYDRVVAHLDLDPDARSIDLRVLTGTPGAAPEPPALTRTATVHEISLCKVRVRAAATLLEAADLTDERPDESVCGWAVPESLRQANLTLPGTHITYSGGGNVDAKLLDLTDDLADKLDKTAVANDLTQTAEGKALDARQGAALNARITEEVEALEEALAESASPYAHSKTGTTHAFAGAGAIGYAVMTADYESGDTVTVNGAAATMVGDLEGAIEDASVLFGVSGATLYVYAIASPFTIPDGATVTPVNAVKTWVECAGTPYASAGSPSLAEVVADADLCRTLMNSQNAIEYLIRSETLQAAALASATALAALDASSPFLSAEMSDASTPAGYAAAASSAFPTSPHAPYLVTAPCASTSVGWWSAQNQAGDKWVSLTLPDDIWVYKVTVGLSVGMNGYAAATAKLQQSVDGSTWTDVSGGITNDIQTGGTPATQAATAHAAVAKRFRLLFTSPAAASYYYANNLRLYGKTKEATA